MDKEKAREIRKQQYQRMKESPKYKELLEKQKEFRSKRYQEQKAWLKEARLKEKQKEKEMELEASKGAFKSLEELVKPASEILNSTS